jgi:hypothetical protein
MTVTHDEVFEYWYKHLDDEDKKNVLWFLKGCLNISDAKLLNILKVYKEDKA